MAELVTHYHCLRNVTTNRITEWLPAVRRYDNFYCFMLLTVFLFILSWAIGKIRDMDLHRKLSFANIKKQLFRFAITWVPPIRNKFLETVAKMEPEIYKSFPPETRSAISKIPNRKPNPTEIKDESYVKSMRGYLSGSRYALKNHSDFVKNLSANFIYANPLHFNIHPTVRQMEIEVVKMCSRLLNFTDNGEPVGCFLSGGTESIMMAILACRYYGRIKGITRPNLVICQNGHPAALKACKYFYVEPRIVDYDSNYVMDVGKMKKQIDYDTVCVYTSQPCYPHGTIDPISIIAPYCKKRDIPVHVDMCLGGFLVPFLKNYKGQPLLSLPDGVTSVSMDPHKFGLSGKGASILLYSSAKLRRGQFFTTCMWPGGLYGTAGIAGSRSGVAIASAWISMMKMGINGYKESAERVQSAVRKFSSAMKELGFTIHGNADICTIAFSHPKYPSTYLQPLIKYKEWGIALLQKPIILHFSFTPLNSTRVDNMIKDIREIIKNLETTKPEVKETGEVQLYCACAKIPDDSAKGYIFQQLMNCYVDV